ncbi:MAG: guanylate kinase [Puniceicoccales bacterium]|jgi:guanylate kinase|nr:guanylate kinase [Puniceicoccales bacterium]
MNTAADEAEFAPSPRPLLLLVSGPAGCGKTTLCDRMTAFFPPAVLRRVVTCTTRAPRGTERDGHDYHFLARDAFEREAAAGNFLEHALVHGNRYGTRRSDVLDALRAGNDLLLNLDVQGADSVRAAAAGDPVLRAALVSMFILPPSRAELRRRLAGRGTDHPDEIERRLRVAESEMQMRWRYDYCLVSGDREADFERVKAVYLAEKMRVPARP